MSTDPNILSFSAPPQVRSSTGVAAQHSRFDQFSNLMLWAASGGAIDISDAAATDTIAGVFVSTHSTEDLLGGDVVTWGTDDATFALLIAAKINEKTAGHHYWAVAVSDQVMIWPKDPWKADTGTITVDDTGFTAVVANMNVEQAFVTGFRVLSEQAAGIPGAGMYTIGFDHSNLPLDSGASMGYAEGDDDRVEVGGRKPGRFNLRSQSPWKLKFECDQITSWYDMGGGKRTVAADTEVERIIYQWREFPVFIQAAAAATPSYENASY